MISHKHKCIFIHISKCAGTSVENAFGVHTQNLKTPDYDHLFGWDEKNKLWLQHATPKQLIDLGYIEPDTWNEYYKFIIYRNSWSRAYSDYIWIINGYGKDSFSNFLNKTGKFEKVLNDNSSRPYLGDHLYLQKDYFFLNDKRIKYDIEIDFDSLEEGFSMVRNDLDLPIDFFSVQMNSRKYGKNHYSFFYNSKRKNLVFNKYKEDIDFFGFEFEDKRNYFRRILSEFLYY
ncbi:sulfotransferase family 2 domain-containing protein [Christiangramia crocea]|uniref:Sulfotransferase family 2 domain-containing protein n=1 Tax=Christiangramia crocea TaxID=2904124 RepID=A0A9X1UZ49_9FLAO|nr:sulfotransferase family 2 domain-containing protein [Gramella crocea]MCG9973017.1 sulfotransferase family 2 domain-containing protein [Gramella crocea]